MCPLQDLAAEYARGQAKVARARSLKERRRDELDLASAASCPKARIAQRFRGAGAFVARNIRLSPGLQDSMQYYGFGPCEGDVCRRATVVVVNNVAALTPRQKWVLSLRGGVAVTPRYICTRGQQGVAMPFCAAIATARKLWLSPEFRRVVPNCARLIEDACAIPESKWKLVPRDVFDKAQHRDNTQMIALVTRPEKKGAFRRVKAAIVAGFLCSAFFALTGQVASWACVPGKLHVFPWNRDSVPLMFSATRQSIVMCTPIHLAG